MNFHLIYWRDLLPIFLVLCFPVMGDLLHSVLIHQLISKRNISPGQAVQKAWSLFPSFFYMKLQFEVAAILWGIVPIYGIIQGTKHRLHWAMASNVLVFEGLSKEVGCNRCRELVENLPSGIGVRTLVTVPSLLITGLFLAWAISGSIFESFYSSGFWILIGAVCWIVFIESGAVNTFLYLEMTRKDHESRGLTYARDDR